MNKMALMDKDVKNLIFALDIGTRSVIGVVGEPHGDIFKVLHVETVEHTRRAVVDGQIEDIEQTARIAELVKERLEAKIGANLTQVHIAAAGRVLRTQRAVYEIDIDSRRPLDSRQVFQMESEAIQSAYEDMMSQYNDIDDENIVYYCVGHSVIKYTLDGYSFATLEGHRGKHASVELVATFLPNEVIESLYATMQRIGLTVASLTLEPIAAISAVIPQELRLLNIALVDIGAGTSDIAITNGGSVVAYTMAVVAGDEITECVMHELLVDFREAERVKFALSAGKNPIGYTDILGNTSEITADSLMERIKPSVNILAKTIADQVIDANGNSPMAIFLVGGGSRTPGLCPLVAQHVGLDETKVAIGGSNYMKRLIEAEQEYLSAEYSTPMGIAVTAAGALEKGSFYVTLNGRSINIQSSTNATVMEILLRSGYEYSQIMGRSGYSVTYELNGVKTVARGGLPTLANIAVNGQVAAVTTQLQADDVITFEEAENGEDADTGIEKVFGEYDPFSIVIDGEVKPAGTVILINGMPASVGQVIRHMDKVEHHKIFTLQDLLSQQDYSKRRGKIYVNGADDLPLDTKLAPGDQIVFSVSPPAITEPKPEPPHITPVPVNSPAVSDVALGSVDATASEDKGLSDISQIRSSEIPAWESSVNMSRYTEWVIPQKDAGEIIPPADASGTITGSELNNKPADFTPGVAINQQPADTERVMPPKDAAEIIPPTHISGTITESELNNKPADFAPSVAVVQEPSDKINNVIVRDTYNQNAYSQMNESASLYEKEIAANDDSQYKSRAEIIDKDNYSDALEVSSRDDIIKPAEPLTKAPSRRLRFEFKRTVSPKIDEKSQNKIDTDGQAIYDNEGINESPDETFSRSAAGRFMRVTLNGKSVDLAPKPDGSDFFFFDVLGYTDIDPSNPQGEIMILRNGRSASYIELIQEGDDIQIYWKK